jgi:hypothetical protein
MIKTVAAVVCVLAMGVVPPAQAQDASGRWEATFYTQQGPLPATVVLKKDGEKLTGTVTSQQGELAVSGTQKGNDIALNATLDMGNGPMSINITGKQDGDSLTGSVDFGGQGQADWGAKRAAAGGSADKATPAGGDAKAGDVSGTWALELTTANGGGTPTVTLKQDGGKLTGQYSSQMIGEAPVTGSIKGSDFTFQFNASVQGTTFQIVYTGTLEGSTMKGTVKLGDMGEGTFTGKRK